MVAGHVRAKKVPGTLHIKLHSPAYSHDSSLMNSSHVIHHLSFGGAAATEGSEAGGGKGSWWGGAIMDMGRSSVRGRPFVTAENGHTFVHFHKVSPRQQRHPPQPQAAAGHGAGASTAAGARAAAGVQAGSRSAGRASRDRSSRRVRACPRRIQSLAQTDHLLCLSAPLPPCPGRPCTCWCQVVCRMREYLSGSQVGSYSYTMHTSSHKETSEGFPSIKFSYDLSPMKVVHTRSSSPSRTTQHACLHAATVSLLLTRAPTGTAPQRRPCCHPHWCRHHTQPRRQQRVAWIAGSLFNSAGHTPRASFAMSQYTGLPRSVSQSGVHGLSLRRCHSLRCSVCNSPCTDCVACY
jgi:hypothetical protein